MSSNIHPYRYGAVTFLVPLLVEISRDTALDVFVYCRGNLLPARGRFGPAETSPLQPVTNKRIATYGTSIMRVNRLNRTYQHMLEMGEGFYTCAWDLKPLPPERTPANSTY